MLSLPEDTTATNRLNSGDQQMSCQSLSLDGVRAVQVIPSGEVITRSPVPVYATATNKLSSGDQQTERQLLSLDGVRAVQVIPSGEVIMLSSPE